MEERTTCSADNTGRRSVRLRINTAITGLPKQKDFLVSYEPATLPQPIDYHTGIAEEQLKILHKAIEQWNQVEKAIVMLYIEDKVYEEMEDIPGISQENLRVKMNRIKEKFCQITKND